MSKLLHSYTYATLGATLLFIFLNFYRYAYLISDPSCCRGRDFVEIFFIRLHQRQLGVERFRQKLKQLFDGYWRPVLINRRQRHAHVICADHRRREDSAERFEQRPVVFR